MDGGGGDITGPVPNLWVKSVFSPSNSEALVSLPTFKVVAPLSLKSNLWDIGENEKYAIFFPIIPFPSFISFINNEPFLSISILSHVDEISF